MIPRGSLILIFLSLIPNCYGWNQDDLSLYDLVEEVNQNFYELFDIAPTATTQEIKKAYRRLSLEWHPDRNSAENASEKFRQVVGVYEVLKDKEKREKYDSILENGMPDWRSGIYYYRRYRKMGGAEACLVLFIALTGGHYLMLWGSYFEKYLVENQGRKVRVKKGENKKQAEEDEALRKEQVLAEYRPTLWHSLPVLMVKLSYSLFLAGCSSAKESMKAKPPPPEENPEEEIRRVRRTVVSQPREERVAEIAQITAVVAEMPEELKRVQENVIIKEEGVWSAADMAELVKLSTVKYPPGMGARWQHIAKAMGRTVEDVTTAAKKIKHSHATEELAAGQSIKVEDRSGEWSKEEQKLLEGALIKYPKGTEERWDRIAEELPGRTKNEVIERFKQLAEMIKAKRAAKTN